MRILKTFTSILLFYLTIFISNKLNAQNSNINTDQDPKFEQLLNEKRKVNQNISYTDRYKIQIYNGTSELAKKTLTEFRIDFKNLDGTIIFNTPNYKVWVGNFRTRMEAEKNLIEIKKKYKTVFLIKPSK
jgi:hypothetical protein